tara:strand:- start:93 stop:866 length:774 start_codon:yes stop_codon:yes gene_type:complete
MENSLLEKKAKKARKEIFKFKTESGFGHLASCLCCVDFLVSLYYDEKTNFDHKKDTVIFSKAHGSPALYPILVDLGYVEEAELEKYCQPEGMFRLHSDSSIPGCHFVGGSLGNGIGHAAGLAYSSDQEVYVVLGDAELYEGSVWETLMFVTHHNINNLHIIIDRNGMGILGHTEELLKLEPLGDKFKSFGFDVEEVDGHDFSQLRKTFLTKNKKPKVTIANTIKGKGVSYMEGKWQYHTIIPSEKELLETGIKELTE